VGNVCAVLFFLLFPSGRFAPRWMRWLAVAFCVYDVTGILVPELYSLLAFLGIVVSLVWSQIYSYRRFSTPAQRRQTKWVVFGTTLGVAGTFPFQLPVDLSLVDGNTPLALLLLRTGFALSFLLVPLSISVAVLRSHLFDIDVLINRTLVYGSLTAMLIGLYFGTIVVMQRLFVVLTGEKSTLAVVASTLLIAARELLRQASRRDRPRCSERRSGGSGQGDNAARAHHFVGAARHSPQEPAGRLATALQALLSTTASASILACL
jgi:hypothetical protein